MRANERFKIGALERVCVDSAHTRIVKVRAHCFCTTRLRGAMASPWKWKLIVRIQARRSWVGARRICVQLLSTDHPAEFAAPLPSLPRLRTTAMTLERSEKGAEERAWRGAPVFAVPSLRSVFEHYF